MKLYRIFTENKNYTDIIAQLQLRKLDATIFQTNGLWQGRAEKSLCIETTEPIEHNTYYNYETELQGFIFWLKKHNKQDKVLLQQFNIEAYLL